MDIRAEDLWRSMLGAVKASLGTDWKAARHFADPELKRLARVLVDIGRMAALGQVTEDEARALLRIHRNTTEMVLLAVKGLGILAVENAVNAALGTVRDTVNGAAGMALL